MSRFPERDASALVVADAQQGPAISLAADRVLDTIADLVARARLAGVPVLWLRRVDAELRPGEPDWQLSDRLAWQPGEVLIDHAWDDGFIETDLADVLGLLGAGHLWLAGLGSDATVLQTYLGALQRGFDVTLVEDAHAAADVEFDSCELSAAQVVAFVNRMVWRDFAPDVTGDLMAAANVEFNADEPDDLEIIAAADAESAMLEQIEDDLGASEGVEP